MANGNNGHAVDDGDEFRDFARLANRIRRFINKRENCEKKQPKIEASKQNFLESFKQPRLLLFPLAALCFIALIFDFIVSSNTLVWLSYLVRLPVQILAFIFSVIDLLVAILATGIFAKTQLDKDKQKKRFNFLLWFLCALKIILFVIFVHFIHKDLYSYAWVITFLQACFIFIVYLALYIAGNGLAFACGNICYTIWKFWNGNSVEMQNRIDSLYLKLKAMAYRYGIDYNKILTFYHLNRGIKNDKE